MENEKEYWAKIINDARLYNGTPHMLTELTEHFMKHYKVALRQPPVSGNKVAISIHETNMVKYCNPNETWWMELPKPPCL